MNILWSYFWPCFAAGLIVGGPTGTIAFRRPAIRTATLAIGLALTLACTGMWHGPLGGADRFAQHVEQVVSRMLVDYEMPRISSRVQRNPMARQVQLSGPADDFQRGELVRLIDEVPGVAGTSWSRESHGVPLIAEGSVIAILGFLFGLVLAYLADLRRRYNANWNW